MRFHARSTLLVLLCSISGPAAARAQELATPGAAGGSFWRAATGGLTVNWVTWAYNWYVQRWPWAKVGTQTWARNLRDGFHWDNDCFLDNQLAHPYHGSLYHSSARASGYEFWSSIPFVAAGSATWELFGENITASLNDLINTTLGGVAIGEVTYRLSSLVGSKRARGPKAIGRDLGAFALSPIGWTQGLLQGDRESAGSPGLTEQPASLSLGRGSGHPVFELGIRYGTPYGEEAVRPYDAFTFRVQVSPGSSATVRIVEVAGLLARASLSGSPSRQAIVGLFQHYDYLDLSTFRYSGHSLSGGLLYRYRVGRRSAVELGAQLEGVLLGAISSDHGFEWRRDYDLGPGAGGRIAAAFSRDGREWLRVEARTLWLHSLHGSDGQHLAGRVRLAGSVPLRGPIGLGGEFELATRHSTYPDFPSVTQRVSQLRGYLTWAP